MTSVHSPAPVELPSDLEGWRVFATTRADDLLDDGRAILARLADGTARSAIEVLELWNDAEIALAAVERPAQLLAEVHPDEAVREASEARAQAAEQFRTERDLDRGLWEAVDATDPAELDPAAARLREHILRDFRRAGVDRDDATRGRLRELADRSVELGLSFDRNIRDGKRSIRVEPGLLDGLPQDFRDAHPVGADGLVTLTTEYPDLLPVREFARSHDLRAALMTEFHRIAWPENEAVLADLVAVRRERAQLLGYLDWAAYEAEPRMIAEGARIPEFIDRIDAVSAVASATEYATVLDRIREDRPDVVDADASDFNYYLGRLKEERHDVDAQLVRSYFRFEAVRQGLLDATSRLFDVEYVRVDAATWHPDVAVYDVVRRGELLGRIHLDLHPRANKFNHAACFDFITGIEGRIQPVAVLVCNFSDGLMGHDDVVTFFHEFGHLVHAILGGRQRWQAYSGVATEWDFVEAPSQFLEEWAWNTQILQTFARNEAGDPIPDALVAKMRAADTFGRALEERRQLGYTAVSYHVHVDETADLDALTQAELRRYNPFVPMPGGHLQTGFGHLNGYGACYYTYRWSLVIARDLLSGFNGDLLDPVAARRYRECILEPGGSKDAAELISDFLGRGYRFDAFQAWLEGR